MNSEPPVVRPMTATDDVARSSFRMLILQGISASGKSTYANSVKMLWNAFEENAPTCTVVSRDAIRAELLGEENLAKYFAETPDYSVEETVTKIEHLRIARALGAGEKVVIDNTNLTKKYVVEFVKIALDFGIPPNLIVLKRFDIDLPDALNRNQYRSLKVPQDVITQQYTRYQGINWDLTDCLNALEDYHPRKWHVPPFKVVPASRPQKRKAIICDIDGTLAHRVLLSSPKFHYRSYYGYEECNTDLVDPLVSEVLKGLASRGYTILFVTGRKPDCMAQTKDFLANALNGVPYQLFCRQSNDDNRSDDIVKYEIFNRFIRNEYAVEGVIDDRKRVIALWEALGLRVMNVGLLNEEF